jgi:hypothetical protein
MSEIFKNGRHYGMSEIFKNGRHYGMVGIFQSQFEIVPKILNPFCGCCGDEPLEKLQELTKLTTSQEIEEKIKIDHPLDPQHIKGLVGVTIKFMNEFNNGKYDELYSEESDHIIDTCLYFLKYQPEYDSTRYITLWSLLYNYFKFEKDTYSYFVMQYLDSKGVIEHGSGIRCAWLTDKTVSTKCNIPIDDIVNKM